jgi:alkanesulfonate monooxygenase SsuD/methylene tetrahydromethanopterin reductase-like flavin-dependent oxidoreductase (luciferase family)
MLRTAGEIADGVHVHPLNTPTYLAETVLPETAAGARRAGRDPSELTLTVPVLTAVGDTEEERARWREVARVQVAFYGSTANYGFIFDQVGFEGTTARIRERQKAGDLAGMSAVVTDDILEHFVVTCAWDELSDAIVARLGGVAHRAVAYFAGTAWQQDQSSIARWGEVARDIIARTS